MSDPALVNFSENVKALFQMQDQMRDLAKEAKEKRDPIKMRLDELQESIKTYMEKSDVQVCNFKEQKLELKKVAKTGSLTKKTLLSALTEFFRDETRAQACFDAILKSLGTTEVSVLRRSKIRKRKGDDAKAPEAPEAKRQKTMESAPDLDSDSD